jgi:hypothetical protein
MNRSINPLASIPKRHSLRRMSFKIQRSLWADDNDLSHTVVTRTRHTFEKMPALVDGSPRTIELIFDDGTTEIIHVESRK